MPPSCDTPHPPGRNRGADSSTVLTMPVTLTLLPSDLSDGHELPTGATITVADCGHRAWISPAGAAALVRSLLETGACLPTVCGDCACPSIQAATEMMRKGPH